MKRSRAPLVVFSLVLASCDPVYPTSASGQILAPLDRTCVIDTLRKERTVRTAKEYDYDPQKIAVELVMPQDPDGNPWAIVEERMATNGQLELSLTINFVPRRPEPEYQSYVQKTLEELRDRAIERCGGK
jgi:hypothetical protein